MNIVPDFDTLKEFQFNPDVGVNTPDDVIMAQVAQNIRRGWPQVQPHALQSSIALLVCGGPSLNDTFDKLRQAVWEGGKLITVNGAYDWCIERNLKPNAAIVLDAREFNARFVKQPVPGCRYLIASQCHPQLFEYCADRDVTIWHACSAGEPELAMLKEYYFERTHPITIGTTVGIRAVSLLRMLGFMSFEIFGMDSCWMGDAHHAYEQPENKDGRMVAWLKLADRMQTFDCAPWHVRQAKDFLQLVKERGNLFRLCVHGDGLIATMLRTGAEIEFKPKGD